jgi:hypothetical protein
MFNQTDYAKMYEHFYSKYLNTTDKNSTEVSPTTEEEKKLELALFEEMDAMMKQKLSLV